MDHAVVACSSCGAPWAVATRHRSVACPGCGRRVELATRRRLWEGQGAAAAAHAAARLRADRATLANGGRAEGQQAASRPLPRHDSHLDAAAAQARRHRNLSRRADEVALWLTRLAGGASHDDTMAALAKAGIDGERAERELLRLLAGDVVFEPRPGWYEALRPA